MKMNRLKLAAAVLTAAFCNIGYSGVCTKQRSNNANRNRD